MTTNITADPGETGQSASHLLRGTLTRHGDQLIVRASIKARFLLDHMAMLLLVFPGPGSVRPTPPPGARRPGG